MKKIGIIEIVKKCFGENCLNNDDDIPDIGTAAHKIRSSMIKLKVPANYAKGIHPDIELETEDEVDIELEVEDYLGHHFREDFLCHFRLGELPELPCSVSKSDLEEWINKSISDAIYSFNCIEVLDLEDDNEVYLEIADLDRISLEMLDSSWVDKEFNLTGENPFEDEGRRNQLRGW